MDFAQGIFVEPLEFFKEQIQITIRDSDTFLKDGLLSVQ